MKKILLLINLIALFFIAGQNSKALAILCCPEGYGIGTFDCPIGVDKNEQCCKWNGPFDYSIVDKIPCPNGDTKNIENEDAIQAGQEVTQETLDALNPLIQAGDKDLADQLSTPGGIVSRFLGSYAFPLAGLILFVMLIWGGVEMMAGSATSKSMDAGKQRITSALIGFLLLFSAYWIARLLEMAFGISIL